MSTEDDDQDNPLRCVIQYQMWGQFGARWYASGEKLGEFIGFIDPWSAYYELLRDDVIVMEIAAADEGEIEVLFETGAPGRLLPFPNWSESFGRPTLDSLLNRNPRTVGSFAVVAVHSSRPISSNSWSAGSRVNLLPARLRCSYHDHVRTRGLQAR